MKHSRLLTLTSVKLFLLLLASTNAVAQDPIDLVYTGVSVQPSTLVAPATQFSIEYTMQNNGFSDATGGINIDVQFDNTNFTLVAASSADTAWNIPGCSSNMGVISCSYLGVLTGSATPTTATISFTFEVNSSAIAANYNFDAFITDVSGVETFTGDNNHTQNIIVSALSAKLAFQAAPNLIVEQANVGSLATMHYEIVVQDGAISFDNGDSATFTVDYDENYLTVDPSFVGVPPLWSCFDTTGQIFCNFGGSTGDVIAQNTVLNFDFDYTLNGFSGNAIIGDTYSFISEAYANTQVPRATALPSLYLRPEVDILSEVIIPTSVVSVEQGSNGLVDFQFQVANTSGYDLPPTGAQVVINSLTGFPFTLGALPGGWSLVSSTANTVTLQNSMFFDAGTSATFVGTTDIISATVGPHTNAISTTIAFNGVDILDPTPANNSSGFDITVTAPPLVLTEVIINTRATIGGNTDPVNITQAAIGSQVVYVIDINNTGGGSGANADNLVITNTLPAGVSFVSVNGIGNFSGCGNGNFDTGTNTLICTAVSLPANITAFDGVEITAIVNGVVVGNITNTASVVFDNDETPGAETNSATFLATAVATLPIVVVTQDPNPVDAGLNFNLIVDVDNPGPVDLVNFKITNTLPNGFSYNLTKNAAIPSGCTINGTNALLISCDVVSVLANGGTYSLAIPVIAIANPVANAIYTNSTTVSGGNVPVAGVTQATTLSVVGQLVNLDYTITLSDGTGPIQVGTSFNYIVTMTNTGNDPINFINFDTTVPTPLSVISFAPDQFLTCSQSVNIISCSNNATNGSTILDIGETKVLLIISVNSTSFIGNVIGLVAAVAGIVDTNTGVIIDSLNQQDTEVTTITPVPIDLQVIKTASVSEITVDDSFDYTLAVRNLSTDVNDIATEVEVIDSLPAGMIMTGFTATDWTCNGNNIIVCSLDTLAAGASSDIVLHVKAPANTGVVINTATISATQPDANLGNNNSQASVDVKGVGVIVIDADMRIEQTASTQLLTSGGNFSWTLKVINAGPATASNIVIEDIMPIGFTYSDSDIDTDTETSCSTLNNTLKCTIASMLVDAEKTIVISGQATLTEGMLSNSATVSSDHDPDLSNNTSVPVLVNVDPIIIAKADLSVDIIAGVQIFQGRATTFDVGVANHGGFSAQRPHVDITLSGIIDSALVVSDLWDCGVFVIAPTQEALPTAGNYTISCDYSAATMPLTGNAPTSILITANTKEIIATAANLGLSATVDSVTLDENEGNNADTANINVLGTPTEDEILAALRAALNGTGNTQVNRAIQNVASYCEVSFFSALEGMCEDLYNTALDGDGETINNVMEQITPNEVIAQSTSINEIAQAQFRNIGARLSQLRSGGGSGFSSAGLNARYGSGSIPLGMLAYLNQTDEEVDGLSNSSSDFISPWGFFVNGTISMGERDATGRELKFDFDSFGLTAGVDYRLDAKKVIGVALGYANFDSKIEDDAELGSTAVTLTGYGSFYVTDNFYVDARISVAKPDFDQSRDIDFTLGGTHVQRTAKGETNANQYSVAMSAGYHFNKKSWNITPNASFRYVKTDIDGFTETGAGDFNFEYSGQELESMVWSAGVRVSKAISLKNGVITPQFDFDYSYESLNDGNDIIARFVMAPVDEIFVIETDSPDRSYGSAGLGIVYVTSNGKQAYINYRSTIGLEGFSRGTFNLGARFEF